MVEDEIGDCRHVVEIEGRKRCVRNGEIRGDSPDLRIVVGERLALSPVLAANLQLQVAFALVAFDQDEIARGKAGEDIEFTIRTDLIGLDETPPEDSKNGQIPVEITTVEYLGLWVRIVATTTDGKEITLMKTESEFRQSPVRRLDKFIAYWKPEHAHVLA